MLTARRQEITKADADLSARRQETVTIEDAITRLTAARDQAAAELAQVQERIEQAAAKRQQEIRFPEPPQPQVITFERKTGMLRSETVQLEVINVQDFEQFAAAAKSAWTREGYAHARTEQHLDKASERAKRQEATLQQIGRHTLAPQIAQAVPTLGQYLPRQQQQRTAPDKTKGKGIGQ